MARERTKRNEEMKQKRKGLRILAIILITVIVIGLGIVAGAYLYLKDKLGKMQQVDLTGEDLKIDSKVDENLSGFRNIVVFCVDSRENDYGKGNRSDGIILVTINNDQKEVNLTSVYRDTYLQIEGHGLDKVTHAYSYGEAPLAIQTLNTNLDLNIKEFVTVNFDAVVEAVDVLGGIELDITKAEMDTMNSKYIDYTAQYTGKKSSHITKTGLQKVDGVQAVSYCRVRNTSGGDYKRTERIRTVMTKMADKLKTKNIGEINKFLDVVLPKVYTNISPDYIISMVPNLMSYKFAQNTGWPYEIRGYTNTIWYGAPVTLESNVIKLHKEVFGEENYEPTETVKSISKKIINKTGYR